MKYLLIALLLSSTAHALPAKLKIGTEGAYKPFNYLDQDGKLHGFDIDITRALCKEAKVECEFVTQEWDGIIAGLIMKKYDAIAASMAVTEERKKKVDFANPYYSVPARFVVKKESPFEISKAGLQGKTIGVQRSTIHANFLKGEYKGIVKLKEYDTLENVNLDLKAGRIDGTLADSATMYEWLKTNGKAFEYRGPDFDDPKWFGSGAAIAVRKGDKELILAFNKALEVILANGEYDRLQKKYFPFSIKAKK
jgi:arginine/ornithine transport system substrate-binding protein